MLLSLHEETTQKVLDEYKLTNYRYQGVISGCVANDLCALTNEYSLVRKHAWKPNSIKSIGFLEDSTFYQSHWGELSALHSMARGGGIAAVDTQSDIVSWLAFLEFLHYNANKSILVSEISTFGTHLGGYVEELDFRVGDLLDTMDYRLARLRSLGMILHIVEDSYTKSHCNRSMDSGLINQFYAYNEQSSTKHRKSDKVNPRMQKVLESRLHTVIKTLMINNSKLDYSQIIDISHDATTSGGGPYAK